jgi:hypothetical protein
MASAASSNSGSSQIPYDVQLEALVMNHILRDTPLFRENQLLISRNNLRWEILTNADHQILADNLMDIILKNTLASFQTIFFVNSVKQRAIAYGKGETFNLIPFVANRNALYYIFPSERKNIDMIFEQKTMAERQKVLNDFYRHVSQGIAHPYENVIKFMFDNPQSFSDETKKQYENYTKYIFDLERNGTITSNVALKLPHTMEVLTEAEGMWHASKGRRNKEQREFNQKIIAQQMKRPLERVKWIMGLIEKKGREDPWQSVNHLMLELKEIDPDHILRNMVKQGRSFNEDRLFGHGGRRRTHRKRSHKRTHRKRKR